MEKFGVPPQSILDYLAIIGDQADNIPGLAGVGPKTASKWLNEYGHLENLILNAGRLTPKRFCSIVYEKRDELRRNLELVRLESDIELDLSDNGEPDLEKMKEIFAELEMKKSWEEAQKRYNLI
jgi:DNA polymerase-1